MHSCLGCSKVGYEMPSEAKVLCKQLLRAKGISCSARLSSHQNISEGKGGTKMKRAPFLDVPHMDTMKTLFLQACMQDSLVSAVNWQQYQKVVTNVLHVPAFFEACFVSLYRSRLLKLSPFLCSAVLMQVSCFHRECSVA